MITGNERIFFLSILFASVLFLINLFFFNSKGDNSFLRFFADNLKMVPGSKFFILQLCRA